MAKTTIELNLSTAFGLVLAVIGLILLGVVAMNAYLLATGAMEPLAVAKERLANSYGNDLLLGIILQVGMFGILIGVAYILMRFGIMLLLRKEKT